MRSSLFSVKPMGFKHTGLFPEQAANWERFMPPIMSAGRAVRVLNLFAYTGGATVAGGVRRRGGLPRGRGKEHGGARA